MSKFKHAPIALHYEDFTDKICKFFNAFENTNTYQILADKADGADVYSELSRTAIRCIFIPNDANHDIHQIFNILIEDISKLKTSNLTFTRFYWVINTEEDIELSDMVLALNDQHNFPFRMYYWGTNTLLPYFEQYKYLFKNPARYKVRTKYPKMLTQFNPLKQFEFLGLNDAKESLHEILVRTLKNKKHGVLIYHPVSGKGKTVLGKLYIQNQKYNKIFDHIAYIHCNTDVRISVLEQLVFRKKYFSTGNHPALAEIWNTLISKLNSIEGNNLLVIDNLPVNQLHHLNHLKWKILGSTSETPSGAVEIFQPDTIQPGVALKLLSKFTQGKYGKRSELQYLEDIYFNPALMKLWAKILESNPNLTLEKLHHLFELAVKTPYHTRNFISEGSTLQQIVEQKLIAKFYLYWFDYNKNTLTPSTRKILRLLSILPSEYYNLDEISELAGVKKKNADKLLAELNNIAKLGIISHESDLFHLPELWQRVVLSKLKTDIRQIDTLVKQLNVKLNKVDESRWFYLNVLMQIKHNTEAYGLRASVLNALLHQYTSLGEHSIACKLAEAFFDKHFALSTDDKIVYLLHAYQLSPHSGTFKYLLYQSGNKLVDWARNDVDKNQNILSVLMAHCIFLVKNYSLQEGKNFLEMLKPFVLNENIVLLDEAITNNNELVSKQNARLQIWKSALGNLFKI